MAGSSDKTAGENEAGKAPDAESAPAAGTSDQAEADAKPGTETEAEPEAKTAGGGIMGRRKKAKPAEKSSGDKGGKDGKAKSAIKAAPALIRTRIAQVVWLLCVVAALFLALGALVIALDFNQQNAAVEFVLSGAERVDLGVFTRDEGIKEFTGKNAATKNALVNYGVGALFWIVVGRVADRLIRP